MTDYPTKLLAAVDTGQPMTERCLHVRVPIPEFDLDIALTMTAAQVRDRYPRGFEQCPDCGWYGVTYASFAHYVAGDW